MRASLAAGTRPTPFDHPLARFGVVYFDEISAYTTSGSRSLTSGEAITMVDQNGRTLARPVRLNDFAFKTVFAASLITWLGGRARVQRRVRRPRYPEREPPISWGRRSMLARGSRGAGCLVTPTSL